MAPSTDENNAWGGSDVYRFERGQLPARVTSMRDGQDGMQVELHYVSSNNYHHWEWTPLASLGQFPDINEVVIRLLKEYMDRRDGTA
ncbi:unnamed protein product, partial [Mesorhabditis spiculigera]